MRPLWKLVIVHLLANAILLGVGYFWLGIGESRYSALVWSALLALLVQTAASVTYGASLAFFGLTARGQS